MSLQIVKGNLLEAQSKSIVLTIDGSAEGMEGNIARLFDRKWSDAWEFIEDEMIYPLSLGSVNIIEVDEDIECDFNYIFVASTLHHKDTLSKQDMQNVIYNAFVNIVQTASTNKITSVATAVMAGGWRLKAPEAFRCMLEAYKSIQLSLSYVPIIQIYTISDEDFENFLHMAKDLNLLYESHKDMFIVE